MKNKLKSNLLKYSPSDILRVLKSTDLKAFKEGNIPKKTLNRFRKSINNAEKELDFSIYLLIKAHLEILPKEIRDIYNEVFTKEKEHSYLMAKLKDIVPFYFLINFKVPKDRFKEILMSGIDIDLTDDDIQEIIKKLDISTFDGYYTIYTEEMLKDISLEDIPMRELNIEEMDEYRNFYENFMIAIIDMANIKLSLLSSEIISHMLLFPFSKEDLEEFFSEFKISKKNLENVWDYYIENYKSIRFIAYNGNTIDEYKNYEYYKVAVLSKKPKDNKLTSYLEALSEEGLDLLQKNVITSDNDEDLYTEILKYLDDKSFSKEFNLDYLSSLIEYQNEEVPIDINSDLFYSGLLYVYNDNGIKKLAIPDEVYDKISTSVVNNKNENIVLTDMIIEELISRYLFMNGVIDIDKLLDILVNGNHFDITKPKLMKILKNCDLVTMLDDNLITFLPFRDKSIIKEIMKMKKNFGDNYRIVNFEDKCPEVEFYNELMDVLDNIEGQKSGIIFTEVMTVTFLGIYDKSTLYKTLKEFNCLDYLDKIDNIVKKYENDIGLWSMNGFKKNTKITNKIVKNKVGRNDPCPCGSGKKYKKCCGK